MIKALAYFGLALAALDVVFLLLNGELAFIGALCGVAGTISVGISGFMLWHRDRKLALFAQNRMVGVALLIVAAAAIIINTVALFGQLPGRVVAQSIANMSLIAMFSVGILLAGPLKKA